MTPSWPIPASVTAKLLALSEGLEPWDDVADIDVRLRHPSIWRAGLAEMRRYWIVSKSDRRVGIALGWEADSEKHVVIYACKRHLHLRLSAVERSISFYRDAGQTLTDQRLLIRSGENHWVGKSDDIDVVIGMDLVTQVFVDKKLVIMLGAEMMSGAPTYGEWQQEWITHSRVGNRQASDMVGSLSSKTVMHDLVVGVCVLVRMWVRDSDFF